MNALRVLPLRWGTLLWLTAVWCLLWGSIGIGTVLAGLALATVVLLVGQVQRLDRAGTLRPVAALRFLATFTRMLLRSTWDVALLVLRPGSELRRAVVAAPVVGASDPLLTLVGNAISLTPGTLTLEVDKPRCTLYVHVLITGSSIDDVASSVAELERMAVLAFGSAAAREALPRTEAAAGAQGTVTSTGSGT